jgi:glycerol-3-phosphate dehydrogenase
MSDIANVVIIGGGVVGVAIAAEISKYTEDVFLLEAAPRLGLGTSTRNSGVIHAGIYYKAGSLKAFHCVRGLPMLYELCEAHQIPHERTGKLVVADTLDHLPILEELKRKGDANGARDLEIVDQAFIKRVEPHVISAAAIWSPSTGIIEAEELIKTLARIAQANGAHILTNTRVIGADVRDGLAVIRTEREEVAARFVINTAGLYADEVARMFGYDKYTIYPCRGEYAELTPGARSLVNGLVYPLPLPSGHGLGVHFTKTTAGALLIGPNATYIDSKENYEEDRTPLIEFFESARQMVPDLRLEDMRLSYTGIRPKIIPEQDHSFADWVIERDPQWPFVIHLVGVESPGLTGCLSIGQSVREMFQET